MIALEARLAAARARMEKAGQGHVLRFWDDLDASRREGLLREIEALDLESVSALRVLARAPVSRPKARIEPPEVFPLVRTPGQRERAEEARVEGERLLRAGKVACVTAAGGQATRLRFDGPKGVFPIGPVSGRSLFAVLADGIRGARARYGAPVPWYLMTSEGNREATASFFRDNDFLGLPPSDVFFFEQGNLPALDREGRLLLATKGTLVRTPDGHGGLLPALDSSGALADAKRRGIEHLSYFQVDNPLVRVVDPVFLGLQALEGAEMSSKFVRKRDSLEKVGLLLRVDGGVRCVEYSDLDEATAKARGPDGRLLHDAGSIAVHAIALAFVDRLLRDGVRLSPHRAEKPVRALDADGREAEVPAVKFETFLFDALPLARRVVLFETAREEEFSPVKNADGDNSAATARAAICARAARWFEKAGLPLPPSGPEGHPLVEVGGTFALDIDEFVERARSLRLRADGPIYLS